ncbi:MAG: flippase activity-associated protein Agl23, partial [Candidatus Hydrogenedentales bacterium]
MDTEDSRRIPNWLVRILILLAVAGALALRLPRLDLRPFHGDEANQAIKTSILLETGEYIYDPVDHHGPTLYYLALPFAWAHGQTTKESLTESALRLELVLAGACLVALLFLLRQGIGNRATLYAALLTVISPALVFYSRFFIQETLLVLFTFTAIAAGWRYTRSHSVGWLVLAGACAGLMHATKETCVLAFASMAGATACTFAWARLRDDRILALRRHVRPWPIAAALLAAVAVSVLFYSSFFTHWRGVLDSLLTYSNYVQKADGSPIHDKPWYYYLKLLAFTHNGAGPWWSEGLILALAAYGVVVALARPKGNRLVQFLAFYTMLLTAAYSLIAYKTPWCAINFLQPMILLAGYGAVALVVSLRSRRRLQAVAVLLLAVATCHLGVQTFRANGDYCADPRNPYVYAHTSTALIRLTDRVEDIAKVSPEGRGLLVRVIAPDGDYWPLPWYLRKFSKVGYWPNVPDDCDAPVIIAPPQLYPEVAARLRDKYQTETYTLRPG